MALAISATWTAQPGKEEIVREALTALARASRNEPGCQAYIAHQDPEQAAVFKIFEVYDDEDALAKHSTYPHFEEYAVGKASPALADRDAVFTTVLDS